MQWLTLVDRLIQLQQSQYINIATQMFYFSFFLSAMVVIGSLFAPTSIVTINIVALVISVVVVMPGRPWRHSDPTASLQLHHPQPEGLVFLEHSRCSRGHFDPSGSPPLRNRWWSERRLLGT